MAISKSWDMPIESTGRISGPICGAYRIAQFTQAAEVGSRLLGVVEIRRDTHQAAQIQMG